MKKALIFMLVAALLLPCLLAGCNDTPPTETTPEITTEEITTTEQTEEVTTPEAVTSVEEPWMNMPPYSGDGISSENALKRVNIITGLSEVEVFAGQELAKYLTLKKVEIADDGFPIILFTDTTLEEDGFSVDATLRGEEACMTIRGGNERGVLYGVYKFLEKYAGVRYFTPTLEVVPEGDIVIHDTNLLIYEPYFELRRLTWNTVGVNSDWCAKNGVNAHDGKESEIYGGKILYGGGLFVHTLGWLSEYDGNNNGKADGYDPNPCLSSEETYQTVLKNLRARLEEDPTVNIVSVSQNDKNEYCHCDDCMASYAQYTRVEGNIEKGGTAGNLLAFVNRIAEELEKDYPNLIIDTLAYNYTQTPPVNIVPRHNVCIRVCSIRVCFMHPMTECPDAYGPNEQQWSKTFMFLPDLLAWGEICDRIHVWDYTTNFAYYIPPFSNFGAIRANMQMYYEHGVRGMFPQGNGESISGEFGELRSYLLAKLMWDPLMGEEEYYRHMDEFLEAYYGEGWESIRKFIDLTTELAGNEGSCINIYEAPLNSISKEEYLAYEDQIEAWWNTAEELAGDRLEYVQRSRLQWRYIQLLLHPDREACDQFIQDVNNYGIKWAESEKNNFPLDYMFPDLYPDGGNTGDGPQDGQDPVNP